MLPSYVGRPTGAEQGRFLALDLGGTNLRVLAVRLDGRGKAEITAVNRLAVPEAVMRGPGEALFDFLAQGVALFLEEHRLDPKEHRDLAFTFSFPVAQSAVNAGVLLNWTKGFTAAGVAGQNVVALLSDALRRKRIEEVSVTALVNDTVGTLATKSYADSSCDMGVILGTGTNACYPEKTGRLAKGGFPQPGKEMILNLEWGNFDKLDTNACDQALDRITLNPGRQRMEKMVSGMYIGELVRLILLDMTDRGILLDKKHRPVLAREHSVSSEQMSLSALGEDFFAAIGIPDVSDRDRDAAAHVCRIVSRRSARIAGAALAAVVTWMDAHLEKSIPSPSTGPFLKNIPAIRKTCGASWKSSSLAVPTGFRFVRRRTARESARPSSPPSRPSDRSKSINRPFSEYARTAEIIFLVSGPFLVYIPVESSPKNKKLQSTRQPRKPAATR